MRFRPHASRPPPAHRGRPRTMATAATAPTTTTTRPLPLPAYLFPAFARSRSSRWRIFGFVHDVPPRVAHVLCCRNILCHVLLTLVWLIHIDVCPVCTTSGRYALCLRAQCINLTLRLGYRLSLRFWLVQEYVPCAVFGYTL